MPVAFHTDELAAQARAGVRAHPGAIRDFMPEQHRAFFAALPYLFIGGVGADGWPIATALEGAAGFVESPDPNRLRIRSRPAEDDPAAQSVRVGREIGVLGIDFATRRRNRANGVLTEVEPAALSIEVRQSFGNCPQYIQRRVLSPVDAAGTLASNGLAVRPLPSRRLAALEGEVRELIERADTLFVATRSRVDAGPAGGADISHRGGRPGFVRVTGERLTIPDYRGNGYFNTLGNLLGEPRAALLFVDFQSGDVVQLQGTARIDWHAPVEAFAGAERQWHFDVARGWYRPQAFARRGNLLDYSPVTLRTGTWPH
jgi:uncharacterized protein